MNITTRAEKNTPPATSIRIDTVQDAEQFTLSDLVETFLPVSLDQSAREILADQEFARGHPDHSVYINHLRTLSSALRNFRKAHEQTLLTQSAFHRQQQRRAEDEKTEAARLKREQDAHNEATRKWNDRVSRASLAAQQDNIVLYREKDQWLLLSPADHKLHPSKFDDNYREHFSPARGRKVNGQDLWPVPAGAGSLAWCEDWLAHHYGYQPGERHPEPGPPPKQPQSQSLLPPRLGEYNPHTGQPDLIPRRQYE